MQNKLRKVYGIQSILHEFVENKKGEGNDLDLTKPSDMSYDEIHAGVGQQDAIKQTKNIIGVSTFNNRIFSGGQVDVTMLPSEEDYRNFGNLTKADLQVLSVDKGDPNRSNDYKSTGILTNWKRFTAWDKRKAGWGLYNVSEDTSMWDLYTHDGKTFKTKYNFDIPNSERLRDAQEAGLVNGNFFHGFFDNYRPTCPVKSEYPHREENKNITKLCLSFWQPGRSSLDHYKEWDSGVYFIHDWSAQDPAGRTIKRRGGGRCYIIPVTDVAVVATDGVNREDQFIMEAGRPYRMVSDEIKIATGHNTWVVMLYNI